MSIEASSDERARVDLPPRARLVGVVLWCSFLAASVATMICFAYIDPEGLPRGDGPAWWTTRRAVYAIGFFFFWAVSAAASGLTLYMLRSGTGRPEGSR